jgi:transposase
MIQIEFTPLEIEELLEAKERNAHPKIRKKAEVLYLKALKFPHAQIQKIADISRPTLAAYLSDYKKEGLKSIFTLKFYTPQSELDKYMPELKAYFEQHPPCNSLESQMIIEKKTSIKRSLTQIRAFLGRMGLKIRKTGYVPGNLNDEKKR